MSTWFPVGFSEVEYDASRNTRLILRLDRNSEIGVAAVDFDFVLSLGGDCHARDEHSQSEALEQQRQELGRAGAGTGTWDHLADLKIGSSPAYGCDARVAVEVAVPE